MFKNMKSALFWYYLYKFRRRLTLVALLLFIVVFSQWIYSDVVEYLTLRQKLSYLDYLLPIKWSVILFNITLSVYLILSLFKKEEKINTKIKIPKEEKTNIQIKHNTLSKREEQFLYKKNLNSKAEQIVKK